MREYAQRVICPNDLFALKYVHEARLSPDGNTVAYVTSRTLEESAQEFLELAIVELSTGRGREVKFSGRVTYPRWSPDGSRLGFIGVEENSSRIYLADLSANVITALTAVEYQVQGPFSWSPDGLSIALTAVRSRHIEDIHQNTHGPEDFRRINSRVFRSEGQGYIDDLTPSIYIADVRRGTINLLELDKAVAIRPAFSPCGRRILFMGSDAPIPYSEAFRKGVKLLTAELADGHVVEVLDDSWSISEAGWSPSGERIVFAGAYKSDLTVPTMGLWVVNRNGSNPECRTEGFIGNVGLRVHHDMPTWSTSQSYAFTVIDASQAYATVTTHGCSEIWRIALDGTCACEPIVSGLRTCLIMDANAKSSVLLYCVSDLYKPWDLYYSNLKGGEEKQLTNLNAQVLARWPTLKVDHLKFESSDGMPLEGWFLARADRKAPHPTVMFIHAGPFLSTGHAFRFDFHLLAANGFAVLFANFRGSSGYGESFARAIMGDWGARGFPDHMAAIDAAIDGGLADASRLGVWGASHGGFATCWMITHTTRFRAAVAESAATNFSTMYYLSDAPHLFSHDLGGRPDEIPDVYRSRSALTYAWRCRTPTLMLHGTEDLRSPMVEAEQFYRALHDAGCATELVQIPGMNHMGDSTGPLSARRGQNEALLDWFERHL